MDPSNEPKHDDVEPSSKQPKLSADQDAHGRDNSTTTTSVAASSSSASVAAEAPFSKGQEVIEIGSSDDEDEGPGGLPDLSEYYDEYDGSDGSEDYIENEDDEDDEDDDAVQVTGSSSAAAFRGLAFRKKIPRNDKCWKVVETETNNGESLDNIIYLCENEWEATLMACYLSFDASDRQGEAFNLDTFKSKPLEELERYLETLTETLQTDDPGVHYSVSVQQQQVILDKREVIQAIMAKAGQ